MMVQNMNILFLTIGRFESIEAHSIYADLLRSFRNHGHEIYAIAPCENNTRKKTKLVQEKGAHVLHLKTGDVTGSNNVIKKGIAQLFIEPLYINAIKRYFSEVKFELVMYSTPPVTFAKVVEFVKKRDDAKSYLLLKDIFPQNAVDLGMMNTRGVKGIVYKYFRAKEKKLYALSDHIGCMSKANVRYVLKHNPMINPVKVEVCPNSVEVMDMSVDETMRGQIREKYGIPIDKTVFVYGGNLGKPQGIPFIIDCLRKCCTVKNSYFLIIGNGTEHCKFEKFVNEEKPDNVKLMERLPKEDYDAMVGVCDVGLIFLDHRFTIPNFPSRILSYMQAKLPILAATDPNTDIGKVIVHGGFGWWVESNSVEAFCNKINETLNADTKTMGENAFKYLNDFWNIKKQYIDITKSIGWTRN